VAESAGREAARQLLREAVVCDMTLPTVDIPGASLDKKAAAPDRFAAAGFDFVSLTVAVDDADVAEAMRLIARERRAIEARPDDFVLAETAADIERARDGGKLAVGFHFQGTGPVGRNLDLVALYYKLGIRHMLMAYNQQNLVGSGCHELEDDGLSRFGHSLIAEMNRVGMLVDVAHCGYQTSMQTIEASASPVVVSHGNVSAIFDHPRCYRDDQIKAVAASSVSPASASSWATMTPVWAPTSVPSTMSRSWSDPITSASASTTFTTYRRWSPFPEPWPSAFPRTAVTPGTTPRNWNPSR